MQSAEIAALGTALCVALSNVIATPAARHFGPFAFNRWRLVAALVVVAAVATWRSGWHTLSLGDLTRLGLSALIGIVAGDSAIYAALTRLGPRRTSLLYATHAPFAAILGAIWLDEHLPVLAWGGIALLLTGIWLAILFRAPPSSIEETRVHLWTGTGLALCGALGQAVAVLIVRPVMAAGADPSAAASVRIAVAIGGLYVLALSPWFRAASPPTAGMVMRAAGAGWLGMGAGMTLLLLALQSGPVGIVTTLASASPVVILPLLWLSERYRPGGPASARHAPGWQAWGGAVLAVAGVALLS